MILRSWLGALFERLATSKARSDGRKRVRNQTGAASVVEFLEGRRMLTALIVTTNGTITLNEETQVFPYPSFSEPAGFAVAGSHVTVVDPNTGTPPPFYVPGNTAITGGNTNGAFQITANDSLVIANPYAIDADVTPSFTLTFTSTDTAGNTGTATLTIVLNVLHQRPVVPMYNYGAVGLDNEITNGGDSSTSPTTFPGGLGALTSLAIDNPGANVLAVKENSPSGTLVGGVTAVAPDSAGLQSTLTYAFVGTVPGFNAAQPALSIDPFSGQIRIIDPTFFDFEARSNGSGVGNLGVGGLKFNGASAYPDVMLDVQVRATDATGSFSQTTIPGAINLSTAGKVTDSYLFIRVLDVGEHLPSITQATKNLSVPETAVINTSVGYFDMINGTPDFTIPGGPLGNVRVAQSGFNALEPQQRMSFYIVGGNTPLPGNAAGPFAINPDTGEVTINTTNALSYALVNSYNLQIKIVTNNIDSNFLGYVQDVAPLSEVATLHIAVTPGFLPVTIKANQSFTLPEGSMNGYVLGTVIASDPDTLPPNGQGVLGYSIISGNSIVIGGTTYNGIFAIDPKTGSLSVQNITGLANNVVLNYLTQNSFTLGILVEDRGNITTSATAAIPITLTKVDSIAPIVTSGIATIPEHSPVSTVVGTLVATAGQPDFSIASYTILSGNTNTAFAIDANGVITVANPAALSYYSVPNHQFVLTILVTDNGVPNALSAAGTFTINLTQVNQPLSMLPQSFNVNEATPTGTLPGAGPGTINGTVVGQIVVTDPDNPTGNPNIQSFTIDGGNTGGAFSINALGQIVVQTASAVIWDVNTSFSLVVTVLEAGIPAFATTATMTISVIQQREDPIVAAQTFAVPQHSLALTVVGTVNASERDNFSVPLTYAITGGDPTNAFSIDPNTGIITVNDPHLIDYNTTPQFNLVITVTDAGAPAYSSSVTDIVNLIAGSAPHLVVTPIQIPERTPNGTLVETLAATGGVGPYTYTIISGDTTGAFALDPNTGKITVTDATQLDYLVNPSFSFKVLAVDSETPGLGDTATVTINLGFVDLAPVLSKVETTPLTYTENIYSIAAIPVTGTIVATDADSTNARGATIQITSNYVIGQDELTASITPNISAAWAAAAGTLTLSGIDTFANYQAALRSIYYENLSHNPSAATRTVNFTIYDSNAPLPVSLASNVATRNINVVPVNNPPVLSSTVANITYTEGTGAKVINNAVTVGDVDNTTQARGIVTISNYVASEDVLGFVGSAATGNIAISSNSNGVLILTSAGPTATLAQWSAAFSSVTYTNTSGDTAPPARLVTFQSDDGSSVNNFSNVVTSTINITPVFPPVLSGTNVLQFTEHNSAMVIDPNIVVSDVGSTTLASATVTFLPATYVPGQDRFGFVANAGTMGNIGLQSNNGNVLTLVSPGATATLAQWQAALRAVTYYNPSLNPSTFTRSAQFQVFSTAVPTLNYQSNVLTNFITVAATNDPPVLFNNDNSVLSYTENAAAKPIFPNALMTDPKESYFTGAVITITGNYDAGGSQDTLKFANTSKIIGNWNSTTGTLTLTGTDTLANYRAALQSVGFFNQNDGKTTPSRTVTATVMNDLVPALSSNTISRTVQITTVNTPPVLSGIETTAAIYKLNDPYTPPPHVTSGLTITDFDTTNITGATVQITGNYNSAQDLLGFSAPASSGIGGSWNGATGTLTLSGLASLATYQTALRSVVYYNQMNPTSVTTLTRTITFTVTDDSPLASNSVSRTLNFLTTNLPPTLAVNSLSSTGYTQGTPAVAVAPVMTIADPDSPNMNGATIKITGNYQVNEDQLIYTSLGGSPITGTFNKLSGTLSLNGNDTISNYQTALESVKYIDVSQNPSALPRTISFVVTDGLAYSNTVTQQVILTPVDQPPVVMTNVAAPISYSASKSGTIALAPALTVTDPDNTTLAGATITMTLNYQRTMDILSFVNTAKIVGSFNAATGTLTLTGVDTVSNYRTALQSVMYKFTGSVTTTISKSLTFVATDGTLNSAINQGATVNINVGP